ncbi:MAG: dynamin family protein [Planctomycetia bacterium]|nr:dynamin family protein [Planctomycetia bacterium]
MSLIETIETILDFVRQEKIELEPHTVEAQRELSNPHVTIALVGCFQVGKSTILNKAFLGEELLLKQGDGRCTTAVMTKLVYGPEKRLTVVYRDEQRHEEVYNGEAVNSDLIARLTTVDERDETARQAARTEIAKEIKYIQVEYPCEALKQYTFYDTPGIDDPNQELIKLTTLQFLPETDLVILVVDASTTLNLYVKQFLSQAVFQEGLSRVMIMASYRPEYNQSAQARQLILQSIQAELTNLGRGYIPVVSYTFDTDVDGEILHGSEEIQPAVSGYIEQNKLQARQERLAWYLYNDLITARERIKAQLLVSSQTEQEREKLKQQIDDVVREMDFSYNRIRDNFKLAYMQVKSWLDGEIEAKILDDSKPDSIMRRFVAKFDHCTNMTEVRSCLDSAIDSIRTEIDSTVVQIALETQKKTESILANLSEDVRLAGQKCKIATQWDSEVSLGWCGSVNPMVIRVAEIALAYVIFEIPGILLTLFGKNIPLLKNLLPTIFMKSMIMSSIKSSFGQSLGSLKKDMILQFETSQQTIEDEIKEIFKDMFASRIKPYQDSLDSVLPVVSEEERATLEGKIAQYSQVIDTINNNL